ncbi:beta-aspartyl-peptidase (threonine type) [Hephaestia caeni]|uniref:Isoaspartyl peptidase n=1 Tax=Hephaestia caeni TaxID=645617 RepID=A0A397P4S3_9SPHN|nr:isoaspartyl peptidase/L-asparaginase [Hephaestia caeni]RIA43878.1 beta-aspartyl-peptidase (threonine type) [Hephaestia caeni]
MDDWTLLIHGGAGILERGKIAPEAEAAARDGLAQALEAGSAVLRGCGTALDAVEAAVRALEDHPAFNAGRGSVFTYEGRNEMDAAIMDGRDRSAGAVAGVVATRNPISLARAVMEHSPHVMLAGRGADGFSRDHGLEQADADWFALPERRAQLDAMKASGGSAFDVDMKYGTVGAVARDAHGHVAAATSTGGITGKRWGRVGDSPIVGAGTWADDRACAVSCTGSGEFFLRVGVAHEIAAHLRFAGESVQTAADAVMAEVKAMGGTGGVIVVGADGTPAWSLTTPGMYRARARATGVPVVAIFGDE